MSDIAIQVRGLGKEYRIGHQTKRKTFRETINSALMAPLRRLRQPLNPAGEESFWALKDVNFEVHQGEVVGIIGRNGAGKSTLLKILSRITEPTTGEIDINGRVGSLLEVGTGFHPELTGRENIYLNGAILGMKKTEIARKFDEIVNFSEVEKFLDTPVKHYSSGMYMRLAFAVAAHLEPEILIVDEVLAVGDAEFQKKCLGKMGEVSREGRTVLFVSHNMAAVTTLCTKAVYLHKGSVAALGATNDVIARYIEAGKQNSGEVIWPDNESAPGNNKVRMLAVRLVAQGETTADVPISQDVEVEVIFRTLSPDLRVVCSVHLLDRVGNCILATMNASSATIAPDEWGNKPHPQGYFRSTCRIPANFLNDGFYGISAFLVTDMGNIDVQVPEALYFNVHETGEMRKEYSGSWIGLIRPRMEWETHILDNPQAHGTTATRVTQKVIS